MQRYATFSIHLLTRRTVLAFPFEQPAVTQEFTNNTAVCSRSTATAPNLYRSFQAMRTPLKEERSQYGSLCWVPFCCPYWLYEIFCGFYLANPGILLVPCEEVAPEVNFKATRYVFMFRQQNMGGSQQEDI